MRIRRAVARGLQAGSTALRYAVLALLPPRQMLEWTRDYYAARTTAWVCDDAITRGLGAYDEYLVAQEFGDVSDVLVLGCGGGREVCALARRGYRVTGVDFVPAMAEATRQHAAAAGLSVTVHCQDVTTLTLPPASYDLILWTTEWLYQQLPGAPLRLAALRRLRPVLRPGGRLLIPVQLQTRHPWESWAAGWLRAIGWVTWGNRWYQAGDRPTPGLGYMRVFTQSEEILAECRAAGWMQLRVGQCPRGSAVHVVAGHTASAVAHRRREPVNAA